MTTQSLVFPDSAQTFVPTQEPKAFSDILSGKNAFYNASDYLESTQRDFAATSLPVTYSWETESKTTRISKQILSTVIFPVGIFKSLHSLAGKIALLPASNPGLMGYPPNHATESRLNITLNGEWKYKRINIDVNGYKIDAIIVGKDSTLGNGRWVLPSLGNGEFCEDKLAYGDDFTQLLTEVNGNAVVFNYPGVGASSGLPNREAMAKAYRAILTFLEDKKKGVGAREIIGYGHSIGGGVQGDALKTHKLKKDIQYVFVKSRTFSTLKIEASVLTNSPLGFLVKALGWNMDSVESSKELQVPEIIMQTARVKSYEELADSSKIIDDGVIPAKASLAKALLDDNQCPKDRKLFIGMPEHHNDGLWNPSYLAMKINACLYHPQSQIADLDSAR